MVINCHQRDEVSRRHILSSHRNSYKLSPARERVKRHILPPAGAITSTPLLLYYMPSLEIELGI